MKLLRKKFKNNKIMPSAPPIKIMGIIVCETLFTKELRLSLFNFDSLMINPKKKALNPEIMADFAGCNPMPNIRKIKRKMGTKCNPLVFNNKLNRGNSERLNPFKLLSFAMKST